MKRAKVFTETIDKLRNAILPTDIDITAHKTAAIKRLKALEVVIELTLLYCFVTTWNCL